MKLILLVLAVLSSFVENAFAGKAINGDPAPGRSPGPPSSQAPLASDPPIVTTVTTKAFANDLNTTAADELISNPSNSSHIPETEPSNNIIDNISLANNNQIRRNDNGSYATDALSSSAAASTNSQQNNNNAGSSLLLPSVTTTTTTMDNAIISTAAFGNIIV